MREGSSLQASTIQKIAVSRAHTVGHSVGHELLTQLETSANHDIAHNAQTSCTHLTHPTQSSFSLVAMIGGFGSGLILFK